MPAPTKGACATPINATHIFVGGGHAYFYLEDAHVFDTLAHTWTPLQDMSMTRINHACGRFGHDDDKDVIVVGGGHNGLTCGAYLARAGQNVLVLEQKPYVGGASVTEEFSPGFRASTYSFILGGLHPKVRADCRICGAQEGIGFELG